MENNTIQPATISRRALLSKVALLGAAAATVKSLYAVVPSSTLYYMIPPHWYTKTEFEHCVDPNDTNGYNLPEDAQTIAQLAANSLAAQYDQFEFNDPDPGYLEPGFPEYTDYLNTNLTGADTIVKHVYSSICDGKPASNVVLYKWIPFTKTVNGRSFPWVRIRKLKFVREPDGNGGVGSALPSTLNSFDKLWDNN